MEGIAKAAASKTDVWSNERGKKEVLGERHSLGDKSTAVCDVLICSYATALNLVMVPFLDVREVGRCKKGMTIGQCLAVSIIHTFPSVLIQM